MKTDVRCTKDTGGFKAGELYTGQATMSDAGTAWVVQQDDGEAWDFSEPEFRKHFTAEPSRVKKSYGGFRTPHSHESLLALVEPHSAELDRVYRDAFVTGSDDSAAKEAVVDELRTILRDEMLSGSEWNIIKQFVQQHEFGEHLDDSEARDIVRDLIGTEGPARALLENRDRPVRVRKTPRGVTLEFGPGGIDGRCNLQERHVALLRRLAEGRKVFVHDGQLWSVRREASAFIFDSKRTSGRLDSRLLQ